MPFNLHGRHFLKLLDFTPQELQFLLGLSRDLKRAKYAGTETRKLLGKNVALIFEKASTRTRCAFEVAAFDQGAQVTYIGSTGSQMGQKESIADTARVLGRMYDGIQYRGYGQKIVEELAKFAGVPVWNGLTDEFHPTQILADFLTMTEHCPRPLNEMKLCYLGDGRNNMAHSLMEGSAKLGVDFRVATPKHLHPIQWIYDECQKACRQGHGKITVTDDIAAAVKGVDFVYTDVWVSMGEPDSVWEERIRLLKPFQINQELLEKTGNPKVKFLHCLPAFHNTETRVGQEIHKKFGLESMEVTEEVFEGPHSIVWDEAENRLHTIKAIMQATLG